MKQFDAILANLDQEALLLWSKDLLPSGATFQKSEINQNWTLFSYNDKYSHFSIHDHKNSSGNFSIRLKGSILNKLPAFPDSIEFAKLLADTLNCDVFVECDDKYTHPLGDEIVRVTTTKVDLVFFPGSDEPIDEQKAELIELR